MMWKLRCSVDKLVLYKAFTGSEFCRRSLAACSLALTLQYCFLNFCFFVFLNFRISSFAATLDPDSSEVADKIS